MPEAVLAYVERHRNCEDIAMAFVVANATGSAPVYVPMPWGHLMRDVGRHSGISSGGTHQEARTACLNAFTACFGGRNPLVLTEFYADT